jgi:PIN domain nuclease of toxin-antitoxin system
MRYLIDTHVLLWLMSGNKRLSKKHRNEIESPGNIVFVSKASLWEIAIKVSINKLELAKPILQFEEYLTENSFQLLDFNYNDLDQLARLDFHHFDPFDRLLICQAITNNLTIVTDDKKFNLYPVPLLSQE